MSLNNCGYLETVRRKPRYCDFSVFVSSSQKVSIGRNGASSKIQMILSDAKHGLLCDSLPSIPKADYAVKSSCQQYLLG